MLLDYIFQFVDNVYFNVGSDNIRSQIAITRLGAKKIREEGSLDDKHLPIKKFVYAISKNEWLFINS